MNLDIFKSKYNKVDKDILKLSARAALSIYIVIFIFTKSFKGREMAAEMFSKSRLVSDLTYGLIFIIVSVVITFFALLKNQKDVN